MSVADGRKHVKTPPPSPLVMPLDVDDNFNEEIQHSDARVVGAPMIAGQLKKKDSSISPINLEGNTRTLLISRLTNQKKRPKSLLELSPLSSDIEMDETTTAMFGVALDNFCDDMYPPLVVQELSQFLVDRPDYDLLFRVPGEKDVVDALKKAYDKLSKVRISDAKLGRKAFLNHSGIIDNNSDPHTIASVLKLFFRQLPYSLLCPTSTSYDDLVSAFECESVEDSVAGVRAVLRSLPSRHKDIFDCFIRPLIYEVCAYRSINHMDFKSLVTCWAPSLVFSISKPTSMQAATMESDVASFTLTIALQMSSLLEDGVYTKKFIIPEKHRNTGAVVSNDDSNTDEESAEEGNSVDDLHSTEVLTRDKSRGRSSQRRRRHQSKKHEEEKPLIASNKSPLMDFVDKSPNLTLHILSLLPVSFIGNRLMAVCKKLTVLGRCYDHDPFLNPLYLQVHFKRGGPANMLKRLFEKRFEYRMRRQTLMKPRRLIKPDDGVQMVLSQLEAYSVEVASARSFRSLIVLTKHSRSFFAMSCLVVSICKAGTTKDIVAFGEAACSCIQNIYFIITAQFMELLLEYSPGTVRTFKLGCDPAEAVISHFGPNILLKLISLAWTQHVAMSECIIQLFLYPDRFLSESFNGAFSGSNLLKRKKDSDHPTHRPNLQHFLNALFFEKILEPVLPSIGRMVMFWEGGTGFSSVPIKVDDDESSLKNSYNHKGSVQWFSEDETNISESNCVLRLPKQDIARGGPTSIDDNEGIRISPSTKNASPDVAIKIPLGEPLDTLAKEDGRTSANSPLANKEFKWVETPIKRNLLLDQSDPKISSLRKSISAVRDMLNTYANMVNPSGLSVVNQSLNMSLPPSSALFYTDVRSARLRKLTMDGMQEIQPEPERTYQSGEGSFGNKFRVFLLFVFSIVFAFSIMFLINEGLFSCDQNLSSVLIANCAWIGLLTFLLAMNSLGDGGCELLGRISEYLLPWCALGFFILAIILSIFLTNTENCRDNNCGIYIISIIVVIIDFLFAIISIIRPYCFLCCFDLWRQLPARIRKLAFKLGYFCYNTKIGTYLHSKATSHSTAVPLRLKDFTVLPIAVLEDNFSYLIVDHSTNSAAVVDPGDPDIVREVIEREGVSLTHILTTHRHWDHAGGNVQLRSFYPNIIIVGGAKDNVSGATLNVRNGDVIKFGQTVVKVVDAPCHTAGHVLYLVEGRPVGCDGGIGDDGDKSDSIECRRRVGSTLCGPFLRDRPVLFTGDTFFIGGCGQFFEGDASNMKSIIDSTLSQLPLETLLFCGHEYTIQLLRDDLYVDTENMRLSSKFWWAYLRRLHGECTVPSTVEEERCLNPYIRIVESYEFASSLDIFGHLLKSPGLKKLVELVLMDGKKLPKSLPLTWKSPTSPTESDVNRNYKTQGPWLGERELQRGGSMAIAKDSSIPSLAELSAVSPTSESFAKVYLREANQELTHVPSYVGQIAALSYQD